MRYLNFGIEIELTGVIRGKVATTIGAYFETTPKYVGGAYAGFEIKDSEDRIWKVVNDSSLNPQKKEGKGIVEADNNYRVEVVSPICKYEDIDTVQEMVRALRKEGAFANESTGIHIHVDKKPFTAKTLRNLVNIMVSKEDLIYKALKVDSRREGRYCKKVDKIFLDKLNKRKPENLEKFVDLWYEGYSAEDRNRHYHRSRYHGLNLHSFFNGNTVEFRVFNSTTHAGKIKACIQFCLAICHQALTQSSASAKKTKSSNPKYTFRTWLLRLGLIGEEFETARYHLLKELDGDIAFRYGRPERMAAG